METILLDDDGLQEIEIGVGQCALGTLIMLVRTWKPSALRTLDAALGEKLELPNARALILLQYARAPRLINQVDVHVCHHYATTIMLQGAQNWESSWSLRISRDGELIYNNGVSGNGRRMTVEVNAPKVNAS